LTLKQLNVVFRKLLNIQRSVHGNMSVYDKYILLNLVTS